MELHTKGEKLFKYEPFTVIFRSCNYFFAPTEKSHGDSRAKLRTLHKYLSNGPTGQDDLSIILFLVAIGNLRLSAAL